LLFRIALCTSTTTTTHFYSAGPPTACFAATTLHVQAQLDFQFCVVIIISSATTGSPCADGPALMAPQMAAQRVSTPCSLAFFLFPNRYWPLPPLVSECPDEGAHSPLCAYASSQTERGFFFGATDPGRASYPVSRGSQRLAAPRSGSASPRRPLTGIPFLAQIARHPDPRFLVHRASDRGQPWRRRSPPSGGK
jgi:hypothetical protein